MGGSGGEEVLAEKEREIGRREGKKQFIKKREQSNKSVTQTNRKQTHTISRGMKWKEKWKKGNGNR